MRADRSRVHQKASRWVGVFTSVGCRTFVGHLTAGHSKTFQFVVAMSCPKPHAEAVGSLRRLKPHDSFVTERPVTSTKDTKERPCPSLARGTTERMTERTSLTLDLRHTPSHRLRNHLPANGTHNLALKLSACWPFQLLRPCC